MNSERETPKFDPEENEEIGKLAVEIANLGEEVIWDLITRKNILFAQTIKAFEDNFGKPGALEMARVLKHEVDIVSEVIDRAYAIVRMEGRDEESQLKRMSLESSFGKFGDLEDEDE